MLNQRQRFCVNAISFQLVWFIAVQADSNITMAITVLLLLSHQIFLVRTNSEWVFIIGFAAIGIVIDSLLQALGLISFSHSLSFFGISTAPLWLICLWLAFATTLCHSLFWLRNKTWAIALLSASGVPLSYYAGAKFSGSEITQPTWIFLVTEACVWFLLLLISFRVINKSNL